MPRALFVSYTFPPVGGAGVQRLTKWLKYLPESGWDSSVLTTENASVPLTDASLSRDIPSHTRVVRARTLEPSYRAKSSVLRKGEGYSSSAASRLRTLARSAANLALQPDPQVLWAPGALRAGRRLLKETAHDVIVATAPPFSALLVAARLASQARLPLVLDYRDEWDISSTYWENRPRDAASRWLQRRMQMSVLRRAQLVIATTGRSTERLADKCRIADSFATTLCIYNGYDAADFAEPAPRTRVDGTCRLVYLGTLWALTDASPLVEGAVKFAAASPDRAKHMELVFTGRRTPEQASVLDKLDGLPCRTTRLDYLEHDEAVRLMCAANGLILLLAERPGAERIVPAKLFEYMAARRPILGVVPAGECRDLLRGCPGATVCEPRDAGTVAEALAREVNRATAGREVDWGSFDPSRYSRASLAAELGGALDGVVSRWKGRPA